MDEAVAANAGGRPARCDVAAEHVRAEASDALGLCSASQYLAVRDLVKCFSCAGHAARLSFCWPGNTQLQIGSLTDPVKRPRRRSPPILCSGGAFLSSH